MAKDDPPDHLILQAVAEREGVDPIEIGPPLQEFIEVDALRRLLDNRSKVIFEAWGDTITISHQDYVELED